MSEPQNPQNDDREPDLARELEHIRRVIGKLEELVEKIETVSAADLAQALQQVIQAFKSLSEVEKSQAEIRKLQVDAMKVRYDLQHAARQGRSEGLQRYITLLTPLVATLVLCLTLVTQSYQFAKSEHDKQDAAEDAQWSEAVKTISQAAKMSPVAIALNPFLKSKRYADVAKKTAVQALVNTQDSIVFTHLFRGAFVPIDWENVDSVLQLDRALGPRLGKLYEKTFIPERKRNDLNRLTPEETQEYNYILKAITEISLAIGPLLKGPRPAGRSVDLRSGWFSDCDWTGVNLNGVDLDNIDLRGVSLKRANLGGVTSFQGAYILDTAWWEASRISPELLQYLLLKSPYEPTNAYGPQHSYVSAQEYEDSVARLKAGK